jgi:hypothetical protein
MQYNVLMLDSNSTHMPLKVLQKIQALVKAGAIVAGPKPVSTTGLKEDTNAFNTLVNELWGSNDTPKTVGMGKVFPTQNILQVLDALQLQADFEYTKPDPQTQLLFVHRKLPTQEFYWVNSRSDKNENIEASFRIAGKTVEIWHPETGRKESVSYTIENGRTKVTLQLTPNDAVFVVFGKSSNSSAVTVPEIKQTLLSTLNKSWRIGFQKDRGAPANITVDKLSSWTDNMDNGVKYFSGTATYTQTIDATAGWFKKDAKLWIDLGDVKNIAEVSVNGKQAGIVWKQPFKVDITTLLKPGKNHLEIRVTNLWVNRLIGDEQPGVEKRITYTTMPFYKADAPLLPSGLLGPVRIISERR